MALFSARGLHNFISDIRAATSKEAEEKRIDKELAKLRNKFTQSNQLNSYDKKKYSWKLIYIYMLGYDIDFGHMQVINMMSSKKYSEKCLGYLGTSILLKSSDELMTLVINSIRNDLVSNDTMSQCLALSCIANMGGNELCESLVGNVMELLGSSRSISHVRKKSALCMRRILQTSPALIPDDELLPLLIKLMEDRHLGVVTSVTGLILTVVMQNASAYSQLTDPCINKLLALVIHKACPQDYLYYSTPNPWLQVKILRILQYLPIPDEPKATQRLEDTLRRILSRPDPGRGAKNNAIYAILFEAVNLIITRHKQGDPKLHFMAIQHLGRFISVQEANIRYIGLDTMLRLVKMDGVSDSLKKHQGAILFSLKDADNSVRRRALDLLFAICDKENALQIVDEMIKYLSVADLEIREEMVLKIAILAEKYAKDLRWYVDIVLKMISISGSSVSDDIWHRVVQIVTNKEDLQQYTAEAMFRTLEPKRVDSTTVKFGSYVLGEFGYLIADHEETNGVKQFEVLYKHYHTSDIQTKRLLLTAFVKMDNLYEEVGELVVNIFTKCRSHVDVELQQRASEYFGLHNSGENTLKTVLEAMPIFPEDRESALVTRLRRNLDDDNYENGEISTKIENMCGDAKDTNSGLVSLDSPNGKSYQFQRDPTDNSDLVDLPRPPTLATNDCVASPSDVKIVENAKVAMDLSNQIIQWYRNLVVSPQGILFENDVIQIGLRQEYRGSQGRIMLFYGNKTGTPINNFRITLECSKQMRMKSDDPEDSIEPYKQQKHIVMVECMQPFSESPTINMSFEWSDKPSTYSMKLPVISTSFFEKVNLSIDDFEKRWATLSGQMREHEDDVKLNVSIDITEVNKFISDKLNLAPIITANESENMAYFAGTFRTGSLSSNGEKISVGCLLKLEANSQYNLYKIKCRAVHGEVSQSINNILMDRLIHGL